MKFKTSNKIYAHIDCDSFFASCEILRDPKLEGKYICVWGEIIVAATYNAKKLGVKVGTPIWEAKKILRYKDSHFFWVHMSLYSEVSKKLMQYLREHTLDVRIFSIDEAFVDISWLAELNHLSLHEYVKKLQQDILTHIGIPVSIGVSNTRLKAKIFSKVNKPFGVCIGIDAQLEKDIFSSLSFREIPFIGSQTSKKLDFHISTILDYIHLGYFEIMRRFWKNGGKLWLELRGVSSMSFLPKKQAKSIGRSRAFNREMTTDPQLLLEKIKMNLERIFSELHYKHYEIKNITLMLIDKSWTIEKKSFEFETYVHNKMQVYKKLTELFYSMYRQGELVSKNRSFQ